MLHNFAAEEFAFKFKLPNLANEADLECFYFVPSPLLKEKIEMKTMSYNWEVFRKIRNLLIFGKKNGFY